jgi:hypothetical protein
VQTKKALPQAGLAIFGVLPQDLNLKSCMQKEIIPFNQSLVCFLIDSVASQVKRTSTDRHQKFIKYLKHRRFEGVF